MGTERSDEDLMLAYGHGDLRAFETIYDRHKGALYRYLRRHCGKADVAEELFQDIWTNLIRARSRYRVRAKFTTYLFRLAHNRVIDYYRRQAHNPIRMDGRSNPYGGEDGFELEDLPEADYAPIEDRLHSKRLAVRLLKLIEKLPPPQREAFLLREETGLSLEEIAEVTGVNAETTKSRLRYAVAKLRHGLNEEAGE
ncbi:MAG: RNA polymerase sigma factor [Gammaproteobacteria bacterium]|nr:RNA polymerase sigma factor [Gammaproteobacteria bacterium]